MALFFRKKLLITAILCLVIFIFRLIYGALSVFITYQYTLNCVTDTVGEMIRFLSRPLETMPSVDKLILGIDSFSIDMLSGYYIFDWVYGAQSNSFIFTLGLFYGMRPLAMGLTDFPFPDPYLFFDPGLYSILVTYGKTNDFFYSGHSGLTCILTLEGFRYNRKYFKWLALAAFLYTICILRLIGGHYTNDIIIGVATACFCHFLVFRYKYWLTEKILNIVVYIHSCLYPDFKNWPEGTYFRGESMLPYHEPLVEE